MWQSLWSDVAEDDVPITSITNGIHVPTWIAPRMSQLYSKYLGEDWLLRHDDPALWEHIMDIPNEEIWEARQWLKDKLARAIKDRIRRRWREDSIEPIQAMAMGALVDAKVLTIGFARRFTEYKRSALILYDFERLKRILQNELLPVQIIFAGKAHPNDIQGKQYIQNIYNVAKNPELGGRIAFVENYDMHIARYLIHGVDVWLNLPRPLQEASGTSGQKAALNGVPHLSVLDGWWYEGYNGSNGWSIYNETESPYSPMQDKADAEQLYDLLEEKIIPLYYERDIYSVPHSWIRVIKESIRSNAPLFSTRRMTKEYGDYMYLQAARANASLQFPSLSTMLNAAEKRTSRSSIRTPKKEAID
jgi:starch phosphorylase